MITRVPSKSSKSSGFNLILQKFYKMICEIIVSKLWVEFSWFFVDRVLLIILWWKNSFSELKNLQMLNISRPIYFKKILAHRFVGLCCTNKLEGSFFWKLFSRTWSFFHDCNTTNLGVIFFHKKLILYFF